MAKRILVPLDRSPVAESIVPVILDLARDSGAVVRLLQVVPSPGMLVTRGPVTVYADEDPRRQESEALDYLTTIERRLPSVAVERVVRLGEPVREILQEAEAFGADLIAVTTSGPSGHGRKALGSVAEQVFRQAWPAVLLYHPPQPRSS